MFAARIGGVDRDEPLVAPAVWCRGVRDELQQEAGFGPAEDIAYDASNDAVPWALVARSGH